MSQCNNYQPIRFSDLVRQVMCEQDLSKEEALKTVEDFFNVEFGGFEAYKAACESRTGLDSVLDRLVDEAL